MSDGFWNVAQRDPSRLAIVDPDGTEVTFGDALARVNAYSHGLRALGLTPGDGVAVVLPNGHDAMEVYLACLQCGLYFTPINWHLTGPEIGYILGDCEAKVFVGDERFADVCVKAVAEAGTSPTCFAIGDVEGFAPLASLAEGQPQTLPDDRVTGQAMLYTSGTTGRPKGVRRDLPVADPDTSGTMLGFFLLLFDATPDDGVHLAAGPLYHAAVLTFSTASIHMGHTVVFMDKWTPEGTLERIERYRVTSSHMVPTMFHRLLDLPEDVRARYDVSSLRNMVHAAAPCPVDTKMKMLDWWGPCIYEYYAATEGGGTVVKPDEWLQKPGTVGQPWPTSEIKIFDDQGNELGPDAEGIVYIKPPGGAEFKYYKDDEKTKQNRIGAFFTVGDVGYLDSDGWLFLRDRKADMIISGGVNIYPAEIENVLATHPKVADVAVIGVPNPDWGEEVKAIVQPAQGVEAGDDLAAELAAFVRERLAGFKCPRSYDFRDALPRTDTGKLLKREIRKEYWADRDSRI